MSVSHRGKNFSWTSHRRGLEHWVSMNLSACGRNDGQEGRKLWKVCCIQRKMLLFNPSKVPLNSRAAVFVLQLFYLWPVGPEEPLQQPTPYSCGSTRGQRASGPLAPTALIFKRFWSQLQSASFRCKVTAFWQFDAVQCDLSTDVSTLNNESTFLQFLL